MKTIVFAGVALGLLPLSFGRADAQVITTNLVSNPGAETGSLTGWTVGGTSNPFVDDGSFNSGINPHTGSFDFAGGAGESGTLTQTISLVGVQGLTASGIDTGNARALLSFWEQGLNQSDPSDDAQVLLTYLNAGNTVISSVSSPEVDSHDGTWTQYTNSYLIPAGTRTINYQMGFIRHVGSDLDSYIDDNSLIVDARPLVTATPEPGSVALLVGIGLSGGIFLRRKRARN